MFKSSSVVVKNVLGAFPYSMLKDLSYSGKMIHAFLG